MRISVIAASGLLLLGLSACGDSGQQGDQAAEPAKDKPVTVRQVCASIFADVPQGFSGDWDRLIREAEYYTDAEDEKVRELANDLISMAKPMLDYNDMQGSYTDEGMSSMMDDATLRAQVKRDYAAIQNTCTSWTDYIEPPA